MEKFQTRNDSYVVHGIIKRKGGYIFTEARKDEGNTE